MRSLLAWTTVGGLLVASPSAVAASGSYKGRTDQNRAVSFRVAGGQVRDFQAGVLTFCMAGGDSSFETDAVANVPPIRLGPGGRFSWTAPDETDGIIEMTVTGRVRGGRATGTVILRRPHSSFEDGTTVFGQCSAKRRWTATAR
ncbi:MAG: hypothetical protein IRZ32_04960 [Solirubrobacteraceae bacterium]|nr:hypothetical protein [Solirubrobacteraceae bacterium]